MELTFLTRFDPFSNVCHSKHNLAMDVWVLISWTLCHLQAYAMRCTWLAAFCPYIIPKLFLI